MRTSYENWSLESCIGTAVMTALIVLPTLSCGVALWAQARGMNTLRSTILERCNTEAAARAGETLPAVGSATHGDVPKALPGLRAELRQSAPAREAFMVCMDGRRSLNVFPVAFSAGTAAPPPASARRTH